MRRFAAISGKTVGSEKLWMGQTHVAPATSSSDHHHGESETAIHVVSGHPEFVFLDDSGEEPEEVRLAHLARRLHLRPAVRAAPRGEPGPRPRRPSSSSPAAPRRPIVVNLPRLYALDPDATTG